MIMTQQWSLSLSLFYYLLVVCVCVCACETARSIINKRICRRSPLPSLSIRTRVTCKQWIGCHPAAVPTTFQTQRFLYIFAAPLLALRRGKFSIPSSCLLPQERALSFRQSILARLPSSTVFQETAWEIDCNNHEFVTYSGHPP